MESETIDYISQRERPRRISYIVGGSTGEVGKFSIAVVVWAVGNNSSSPLLEGKRGARTEFQLVQPRLASEFAERQSAEIKESGCIY